MVRDVLQRQFARAFVRAHLAEAEQPRQPAISVAVDRVSEQRRGIGQIEAAADHGRGSRVLHALCIRTTPASVLRSAMPMGQCPARARAGSARRVRRPAQKRERRSETEFDERRALDRRWRHVRPPHQLHPRKSGLLGHTQTAHADTNWAGRHGHHPQGLRGKSSNGGPRRPRRGNNRAAAPTTVIATIRARSARVLRPARCHAPCAATRTAAASLLASRKSRRSPRPVEQAGGRLSPPSRRRGGGPQQAGGGGVWRRPLHRSVSAERSLPTSCARREDRSHSPTRSPVPANGSHRVCGRSTGWGPSLTLSRSTSRAMSRSPNGSSTRQLLRRAEAFGPFGLEREGIKAELRVQRRRLVRQQRVKCLGSRLGMVVVTLAWAMLPSTRKPVSVSRRAPRCLCSSCRTSFGTSRSSAWAAASDGSPVPRAATWCAAAGRSARRSAARPCAPISGRARR